MRISKWLQANARDWRLTIGVVFCAALGMAATSAVVQLYELTLRPWGAFAQAERLVRVWNVEIDADARDELAWADFRDIAEHVPAFAWVEAAVRARQVWLRDGAAARRVEGEAISSGYFERLGIQPMVGRLFSDEEIEQGAPVMLIAHATWAREFAYADDIVGRTVVTAEPGGTTRRSQTIIGVLPPQFGGTIEEDMPDIEYWIPAASYVGSNTATNRQVRTTWLLAELADGVSLHSARQQLDALAERQHAAWASFDPKHRFTLERFGANWSASYGEVAPVLLAAALVLLGIATFNVFLLLLARVLGRREELALRAALGASRDRLLLECALDGWLLVALGGALGILLAPGLLHGLLELGDLQLPSYVPLRPPTAVLGLSCTVLTLVAVLASVLPARAALRDDLAARLGSARSVAEHATGARLQRSLIVVQIGLACALLTAAASLGQAWYALHRSDLGFSTEQRLRMGLFIDRADVDDDAQLPAFIDRIDEHLRQQRGVRSVAWIWPTAPIVDAVPMPLLHPRLTGDSTEPLIAGVYIVRPGFFDTMEIPHLAGRDFDDRDDADGERVAIVGAALAERLGGPAAALGETVSSEGRGYRIVGVVGDTRFGGAAERNSHAREVYLSYAQSPRRVISPIVHVDGPLGAAAETLPRAIAALAPSSAVDWVDPVDTFTGWLIRDERFRFIVLGLIAASALLLSAAGLHGLMAQRVFRQRREIGLRKALGASGRNVLGAQLGNALRLTTLGLAFGLALTWVGTSALRGQFGLPGPPGTPLLLAIAALLLVVSIASALAPAWRAARVQPMEALRDQ